MSSSAPDPRRGSTRTLGRALSPIAVGLAAVVLALTPSVFDARSGHGDGMGDILTMLFLMAAVPLLIIGSMLTTAAVWLDARSTAVGGAGVTVAGAITVLPVLNLRGASPLLVVVLAMAAAVAAAVSASRVPAGPEQRKNGRAPAEPDRPG